MEVYNLVCNPTNEDSYIVDTFDTILAADLALVRCLEDCGDYKMSITQTKVYTTQDIIDRKWTPRRANA
jgi:hypothetical protein